MTASTTSGPKARAAAAATYLAALTPASFRDVRTKTKDITDALVRVGNALPAAQLRAALDVIIDRNDRALRDALAQKPLPHLEPLVGPALRARRMDIDEFRNALFAAAADAALLHETAKLARVLDRAISIPSMAKLVPKVDAPAAVLDLARPLLSAYAPEDLHDGSFRLTFGFVGLLAKEGSKASLDAIEKFARLNEKKDEFTLQGTVRMLNAAGKGAGLASLVARLEGKEATRKATTDAQALADALDLPMRGKKDWRVSIWIGVGKPNTWFGMFQKSAQVHLSINPEWIPDWEVELRDKAAKRGFDCRGGEMLSNDFRLPSLKTLQDFPRWLAIAGEKIGARFTIADAEISCGRHRGAIAPLRTWLANAR
ncbi:MAG TPA: hypothetical protein VN903_23740 [Polyangia bacterium]|nr:hypothetical protein [Polyangia bacterium]